MKLLLACLLIFIGCKKETKTSVISSGGVIDTSDARLEPYIDTFMDRLVVAGLSPDVTGLVVEFSDSLPSNVLGSCLMGGKSVKINRQLWASLNSSSREELIFHELGHCVLNRLHDSTLVSGLPMSVMYPYHLGSTYVHPTRYANYQTELYSVIDTRFASYLFDPTMYAVSSLSAEEAIELSSNHEETRIFMCPDH